MIISAIPIWVYLLILTSLGIAVSVQKRRHQFIINRWKNSLNIPAHLQAFKQLFQSVDGYRLSQQARQKRNAIEYTYGEIEFLPFIALLSLVNPDCDTVFYDLGSGIGKAIFACAMVYPVQKSVGVELLPELHDAACKKKNELALNPNYIEQAKTIDFILGDFLEVDLNEATMIFINSTTLLGAVWETLCMRLNNLPKLRIVISTSKKIISHDFIPCTVTQIEMSWGIVDVYIHTRKTNFN